MNIPLAMLSWLAAVVIWAMIWTTFIYPPHPRNSALTMLIGLALGTVILGLALYFLILPSLGFAK